MSYNDINDEETEFQLNELCLPTASSPVGRAKQWNLLVEAYRRVAGVPGATYEVEESEANDGLAASLSSANVSFVSDGSDRKSYWASTISGPSTSSLPQIDYSELPTGLFAQGSFSNGNSSVPYSALTDAFNDVIGQLLLDCLVDHEALRQELEMAIGADFVRLFHIVPRLQDIIGDALVAQPLNTSGSLLTADSASGVRYLFRTLVRALAAVVGTFYDGPLVIFLDDAERIDPASAQLLTSLGTETDSDNILFILAVRSEEFHHDHPLRATLKTVEEAAAVRFSNIQLDDLTRDQVTEVCARAIRREHVNRESAQPLSDLVYQRTRGNCFFVVEFLRSLSDRGLLQFNLSTLQWSWQIDQIQAETCVSDNVVDLVAGKLKTLSKEARYVLVMASCIHSPRIDLNVLTKIILAYPNANGDKLFGDSWVGDSFIALHNAIDCPEINDEADVQKILESLVSLGLMERLSTVEAKSAFKFAHEKIRNAAELLIPKDFTGQMLHVRIGELLKAMLADPDAQTWMLFACLDHLNQGPESVLNERQDELVELNHQAADKAAQLSAFVPAATYYKAALDMLEKTPELNKDKIQLQLRLRTDLSICLYRSGKHDESEEVAKAVVGSGVALSDKLPSFYNLIAVYKAQGKMMDAISCGMDLLRATGEKFTKKPSKLRIKLETAKVQKLLKKYSDEQLVALPPATNELKAAAVNVYAILFGPMFHCGFTAAVDLLRLRSIYLTIKYGSSDASALAFAYYGSHLISQGRIDAGYRFGKLSMQLLQRATSQELTARTTLVANFLVTHWKDPLSQTLDRLMKGYDVGMREGDIEMAFTCAGVYQVHRFYLGLSLTEAEKDLRKFIQQMKEYGQHKELTQYRPLHQTMLNLMGRTEHPTIMTGDAMDQVEFEQGNLGVVVMKSYRMQLAYFFDDLPLAEQLMNELRPHSNSFVAPFFQVARRFFFALIRMGVARKAPAKNQAAMLKKASKEDIEWLEIRVRGGAINCLHKLLILMAEMSTFDSDHDTIGKAYDKAVMTAGRSGFSQDEALANELAASFFLSVGNFPKASNYLTRAHELYESWGAHGKVKQLEEKYVLIKGTGPAVASTAGGKRRSRGLKAGKSHIGRQRFSAKMSDTHKHIESSAAFSNLSEDFSVSDLKQATQFNVKAAAA
ncbi:Histidine kinase [Seminavis robusta]|uniref:Histidine kinase n=1 Tax=Seminavis robusta TaxID=568900 RepID=A0A9N8F385_9STRA|nr:Histidine kinase [Seminavis robusta]|eukprot:Sro2661_g333980.1 Histidine kinase (1158) ;mRNA; f:3497-7315